MSQLGKTASAPAAHVGFLSELGDFFSNIADRATDEVKSIAAKVVPVLEKEGEAVVEYLMATAEEIGQMAMASVIAEGEATNKTTTEKFNDAVTAVKQTLTVQGKTAAGGLVNIAVEGAFQTLKTVAATVAADLAGTAKEKAGA